MAKKVLIRPDFQNILPQLKVRAYKWRMEYTSQTTIKSIGHITHYSVTDTPHANIILCPGLASNTENEPLMQAVTYWALKHKYNIYSIDTFLADFKPTVSPELAASNTFPEFIKLMDTGLDILEKQCRGTWTTIVAHSAGATGTFEIFNRRIADDKKLRFNAAIMFAPYITENNIDPVLNIYRARYHYTEMPDSEFAHIPLGFGSPHDLLQSGQMRYVTVFPQFFKDMSAVKLNPDVMNQYNIPITIVGGGHDKKVTIQSLLNLYKKLRATPNGNLFKFVNFQNSKHSFIDQHKDWSAIIELIHAQYVKNR